MISGGDFVGVLEIESKSAEEYRDIKATLSGKGMYGVVSGDASVSFEKLLQSITSSYNMKAAILRDGGEGQLQSLNPDELIKEALNFPAQVLEGKAVPFSVLVLPYSQIPHPKIDNDISEIAGTDCLEKLGKFYQKFEKCQNDLQFAIENPKQFPSMDIDAVKGLIDKVQNELDKIKESAKTYLLNTSICNENFDITLLESSIIPKQIIPSRLGYQWYWEHDGGLFGVLTRQDETNIFKGELRLPGGAIKTSCRTYEAGNEVFIDRYESNDNKTQIYKGTISEDGKEIKVKVYPDPGGDTKAMTIKIVDKDDMVIPSPSET